MINVDDELLHIDNEYSETEIFLKYGVVSLMFYEPTPYIKLIVAINNERDKYNDLQEREHFIPLYEVSFSISIPTDEEGYVLLKCSLCGELFKLKPSDFKDDSIFEVYCPACGLVSDSYVTDDVIELGMAMAENYMKPNGRVRILNTQ